MAQSLKEDTAVPAGSSASSGKTPNDATTRTQPVAMEIPVSINGARTVAGSEKREPFSETTQTVLVFSHGAVVRVNATLAPGQLVFLTNEKTKKEVVCQVIKSKSGGAGAGYVELQFTEASPNFWGLRIAGAVVPAAPAPTKSASPVEPIPPKPVTLIPKPLGPIPLEPPSALSKQEPVPPPGTPISILAPTSPSPTASTPLISVSPPSPLSTVPVPLALETAPPAIARGSSKVEDQPAPPRPSPLPDFTKEIEALFAAPRPIAVPHPEPQGAPTSSNAEQLKREIPRLQSHLSSLLFTETKHEPPAADLAKKALEIAPELAKPAAVTEIKHAEPKFVPPPPPPSKPSFSPEDEEVKIPSWLAPLSQSSSAMTAEPAPAESVPEPPAQPEESSEPAVSETADQSELAVSGGPLWAEPAPESIEASSSGGSKKGLVLGLAAAVLVAAAAGTYYFRPDLLGVSRVVIAKPAVASVSPSAAAATAPTAAPVAENKAANPAASSVASSPAPASSSPATSSPSASFAPSQPLKNSSPAPSPAAPALPAPAPSLEPKTSKTVARTAASPEPPKKPALGAIHLAAPVISHTSNAPQDNATLPSIDIHANSGADSLAVVENSHGRQPAVPAPVGGDVTPAQLIKSVPPIYPPMAKVQHVSGSVQLDALIDASGTVAEIKVLSGPALLQRAALEAVKQWKYKPAILDGQATPMHLTVTVQFRAQ